MSLRGIPQDDGSLSSSVRVGKNGDFANLDALVMDAVNRKIGVQYQDDTDLVVVCGRGLLADKYFTGESAAAKHRGSGR